MARRRFLYPLPPLTSWSRQSPKSACRRAHLPAPVQSAFRPSTAPCRLLSSWRVPAVAFIARSNHHPLSCPNGDDLKIAALVVGADGGTLAPPDQALLSGTNAFSREAV